MLHRLILKVAAPCEIGLTSGCSMETTDGNWHNTLTNACCFISQYLNDGREALCHKLLSFMSLIQILYECFYNTESTTDVSTMVYNMNLVRNSNARGNVIDNFSACKEYANFESDAYGVAFALKYFGMKDITTPEDQVIPPHIRKADAKSKRIWLNGHVKKMLTDYLIHEHTEKISSLQEQATELVDMPQPVVDYPCRGLGCSRIFRYKKARLNHEKKVHSIEIEDTPSSTSPSQEETDSKTSDDVFSYACSRLLMGLLIRNADDAVREGDGEHIIRCWRFFLLYYKAFGHHKYAIAAFHLIANVTAVLTEQQAHQLTWNRFVSNRGGKGHNMSNDFRLENWNNLTKELLKHLGVNLNEKCAERESNAIAFLEEIMMSIDTNLKVTRPSGKHTVKKKDDDMKTLVNDMVKNDIFTFTPGGHYEKFKNFNKDLLSRLDVIKFANWLKEQRKEFMKTYE